jgi:phosphoheptose isomerase
VSQNYSRGLYASEDRTEDDAAVARNFDSALRTVQRSKDVLAAPTIEAARLLSDCLNRGGKVMVCGNGGSAADAQHFAAELLGRFVLADRRALPVISLTADSAFMTAWSNDMGYQHVFSRQLEALGQPGDVLVGISTSGRSQNVVKAFQRAQELGVRTIALLGGDGGNLLHMADAVVVVPSWSTQRIQEIHTIVMHALCELVEKHVASDPSQTPLPLSQASMVLSSTSSR